MSEKKDRPKNRPKAKKKPKKLAKIRRKIIIYGIIIVGILLVALLVTGLTKQPKEKEVSSVSLPEVAPSVAASSQVEEAVVLGPYDEAELPMLLNTEHPLPEGYVPELVDVGYGNGREQTMEIKAGTAFNAMKEAAAAEGITLTPFSCYRSHEHQLTNYNASIQKYVLQGYSNEKATELTQQYFAVPGTSEHEAGFAVDIDSVEESFENTPAFAWLQQHCNEYGFILRYEKETEPTTGIAYEPWHYRYVGANHAKAITEAGITLEEYVANKESAAANSDNASASISNSATTGSNAISESVASSSNSTASVAASNK